MTSPGPAEDFRPTHIVPQEGLPAWESPDVSRPTVPLDGFLPVQLLSRRGDWGEVLCANGWSAWVDGRLLVSVPQPPPTADRPLARTEDARPQLTRAAEALERYRRAVDELASGRTDADSFRRTVRGLRAGVVLDGEAVWVYDATVGKWLYGDESRLTTFAVVAAPGASPGPQQPPSAPAPPKPTPTQAGSGSGVPPSPPPGEGAVGARQEPDPDHDTTRIVDTHDPESG
ncbi:hypothetical protein AB0O22_11405 [Streptomyces sp. NPDC091204]|uniref:hypothetical protein n=1 Tax=Streptomyces sp. NPDC091204 TaxID=3155299 RepID=UPI00341BAAD2